MSIKVLSIEDYHWKGFTSANPTSETWPLAIGMSGYDSRLNTTYEASRPGVFHDILYNSDSGHNLIGSRNKIIMMPKMVDVMGNMN